jgi:hypothetical protein
VTVAFNFIGKNIANIYLFVVYLTTLSVSQIIQRQMIGCLMKDELEKIWQEAVTT